MRGADGTPFKDRQMIVALGIDCDGRKTVLGIREGATEKRDCCERIAE
jgi:transposase-like protein